MLKLEHKYKANTAHNMLPKKIVKNNGQKIVAHPDSLKKKQPFAITTERTPIYRKNGVSPWDRVMQKENRVANQYSPKYLINSDKQSNEDGVDELSQIKFISKECSSIKQNQNDIDCASIAYSGNHLQDFSPLFDKLDRNSSDKDDFILQIYDISEPSQSFENSFAKQYKNAINTESALFERSSDKVNRGKSNRTGTIKKNKATSKDSEHKQKQMNFNSQIQQIFQSLDSNNLKVLTHVNCAHQTLSTEVNYLIGSILTKIKFQNKEYSFHDFSQQFKQLMADSSQSQLLEIFNSNRMKRQKKSASTAHKRVQKQKNDKSMQKQLSRQISFQVSPTFQSQSKQTFVNQKLSKIGQKLTYFLLKNNLIETQPVLKLPSQHKNHQKSNILIQSNAQESSINNPSSLQKTSQHPNYLHSDRYLIQPSNSSNSKAFSSTTNESLKVEFSLRSESQTIRGTQGSEFQLIFSQLNKHL